MTLREQVLGTEHAVLVELAVFSVGRVVYPRLRFGLVGLHPHPAAAQPPSPKGRGIRSCLLRAGDDFADDDRARWLGVGDGPAVGTERFETDARAIAGAGEFVLLLGLGRFAQREEEEVRLAAGGTRFSDGGGHDGHSNSRGAFRESETGASNSELTALHYKRLATASRYSRLESSTDKLMGQLVRQVGC